MFEGNLYMYEHQISHLQGLGLQINAIRMGISGNCSVHADRVMKALREGFAQSHVSYDTLACHMLEWIFRVA